VTTRRLAAIAQSLTERDRRVIEDVDRLGLVAGAQLRRLHYGNDDAARRLGRLHFARLVELRVLQRLPRRVGGVRSGSDGYVYALDIGGQRMVDPDRTRSWARALPGESFVAHALGVSELYVQLRLIERRGLILLRRFDAEPAGWRRFSGLGGARLTLKPDAYVIIGSGGYDDSFFVEFDRATESTPRITEKARLYVRYWQSGREQDRAGVFPLVLWVVPSERRREQLVDALGGLDAACWQLFAVTTMAEAARFMTSDDAVAAEESM
jgi:hypothetical protein